jgi:hypothetical protein
MRYHKSPHPDPSHWYWTQRWRKLSAAQLRREPLCRFHAQRGIPVKATVADHITPHRGNWDAFVTGPLQSLCKTCHDRDKAEVEHFGFRKGFDRDGAPLDPNHPAADEIQKSEPERSILLQHAIRRLNIEI